jgi:hypothetical protein
MIELFKLILNVLASFLGSRAFAMSVAVLARWLKMDAEETGVLWLDRYAEQ